MTGTISTQDGWTRRGFLARGTTVSLATLGLAGCSTPVRHYREKVTIVVDTPEGEVAGSSVVDFAVEFQDGWLGGMAGHAMISGTRGEATVVDLGTRGLLFGLLCEDEAGRREGGRLYRRTLVGATMLTRRGLAPLAVGAACLLAGCDTPARRFRERLTIVVDTPEGEASGSSVVESEVRFQDGWLGGMAGHSLVFGKRGEAVVVNLGSRGLLFALLCRDDLRNSSASPGGYEYSAFRDLLPHIDKAEIRLSMFFDALNRERPQADLSPGDLSLCVRFRDPADPKTVERVDPENLVASFGPGVAIKSVVVEIVDPSEPLTTGIEKALPWLVGGAFETLLTPYSGPLRRAADVTQVEDLTHGDFWRLMQ